VWETIWDILLDTLKDTAEIIPVLFLAYLLMEFLERHMSERTTDLVRKSGRFGPIIGSLLGAFPQCGFSAAASSLYAGRVITVGTLIAVYLSTSDEMLPILLSEHVPAATILRILGLKVLVGLLAGLAVDFGARLTRKRRNQKLQDDMDIHHFCEHEHAHEEEDGIFVSALKHSLVILAWIFGVSLVLNGLIALVGEENLGGFVVNMPVVGELLAGLVGLIPNCAASVVITQLYLEGVIGVGPMMSGLLVGAGIGLVVLFKSNEGVKRNISIVAILYGIGVVAGILLDLLHVTV
jgi:hypothetical protein